MNLESTYLGLKLKNPILCGASPLSADLETVKKLEEAGIAGIVMNSLFEEEILGEIAIHQAMESFGERSAEAVSYMTEPHGFHLGPDSYLEALRKTKETLSIPVIGSLNGSTQRGWTNYAKKIEEAGADAIELNLYHLATDTEEPGSLVEFNAVEVVRSIKREVSIPLAVKLSPFYSSFANMAKQFAEAGADGLVMFNRFYQPDIDIEELETLPALQLSDSSELNLRLRWLALLSGKIDASFSATGGVHTSVDVIKAVMSGAASVQMVSAILKNGPDHIKQTLAAVEFWLTERKYESLDQMLGSMSAGRTPNPAALERANYMKVLDSWNG